jgi:hypothetical protein
MNIKSTLALSIIADILMWYRSMTLEIYNLYLLIWDRFALRGELELMMDFCWDMQQEFCSEVKYGVNMLDRNFKWIVLHIISYYRTTCGNTNANPIPQTIFNHCPQAEKNVGMPVKRSINFDELWFQECRLSFHLFRYKINSLIHLYLLCTEYM